VLVAAACGGGGGTKTVTVTQTVTKTVAAPRRVPARIYLVRDGKVAPVARSVTRLDAQHLTLALEQGPTAAERAAGFGTSITVGSAQFDTDLAVAQWVFTLSQSDPSKQVQANGRMWTRADLEDATPIILVESPLPFAHVTSPLNVTGTANTLEATFDYDLVGANGKVLAHHFVTATSGNGVRGTFSFTAPFTVSREQQGKLVVYEVSAANGKRIQESEIPLTLEP